MHTLLSFPFGSSVIHIHLIFEMLAFTVGYRYYVWQRNRSVDPVDDDGRFWVFIGAAFGAFWGSHMIGALENPLPEQHLLLYFMANKTIVGGLLGGLAGVELIKKIVGIRVSTGDLMALPLIAGLCIGRVGCHLEALDDGTFGLPSDLPWAMDFGDGTPRHPVSLYEILFLGLLGLTLFYVNRWVNLPSGALFKTMMTAYLTYRFFAEYLKPAYFWPQLHLSTIQISCLAGLVYYLIIPWKDRISTTTSP